MSDTASALPLLVRLSHLSASPTGTSPRDITEACEEYEAEMIPRAFEWVKKSGGVHIVVRTKCPIPILQDSANMQEAGGCQYLHRQNLL